MLKRFHATKQKTNQTNKNLEINTKKITARNTKWHMLEFVNHLNIELGLFLKGGLPVWFSLFADAEYSQPPQRKH